MSLPPGFQNFDGYFEEIVLFLQKYSWIYEAPVTSILTSDIFSKIPRDWIDHLIDLSNDELNEVPTGLVKDGWPNSLIQFSQDCQKFTLPVLTSNIPLYTPYDLESWRKLVPREIWRGMSPKKKNEVQIMSALVHHESKALNVGKILDLGSGLGYIDRLLLLRGYRILGVESQPKLVSFSTIQKDNFFPINVAKNLEYYNMRICESLIPETRKAILKGLIETPTIKVANEKNKNENVNKYEWDKLLPLCKDVSESSDKVCMIGLHTCGDLSVAGLKLFLGVPEVTALVLVPCCYHKMSLKNDFNQIETEFALEEPLCETDNESCEDNFHNFPLSESLAKRSNGCKFVCRPFLRLANQATNSSWQGWTEAEHQRHAFNVLSRAVVELFAQQEGATFKKCFRRVVRKTSLKEIDFTSYVDESLKRCEFVNSQQTLTFQENKEKIRSGLLKKWEQHKNKVKLAEVLTALQMCLESVAESLVVADRVCFLHENGAKNVRVVKMMDNNVSPRSLAFIVSKA